MSIIATKPQEATSRYCELTILLSVKNLECKGVHDVCIVCMYVLYVCIAVGEKALRSWEKVMLNSEVIKSVALSIVKLC